MKHRNPFVVFILFFVTFGIYYLVWSVKTSGEMRARGAEIPTAWLIIIPFVNWYWLWKWSEGCGKTTNDETSAVVAFILLLFLGPIGMAVVQSSFNKV